MARLTRRNMLTASLATVASGVFSGAGAAARARNKPAPVPTPEVKKLPENKFLLTPQNPIIGGDAVPVGIKIASAWLRDKEVSSTVTVNLLWNLTQIAVFNVGKPTIVTPYQDVKFATRIKIPTDVLKGKPSTEALTGNLSVEVIPDGKDVKANQSVELEVTRCDDCSTINHGQLVLATQPAPFTKDKAVAVKSYVPVSAPASRLLKGIDCLFAGHKVIEVDVKAPSLLSDEVFLAVDFPLSDSGMLEMSWTYSDGKDLKANVYLTHRV